MEKENRNHWPLFADREAETLAYLSPIGKSCWKTWTLTPGPAALLTQSHSAQPQLSPSATPWSLLLPCGFSHNQIGCLQIKCCLLRLFHHATPLISTSKCWVVRVVSLGPTSYVNLAICSAPIINAGSSDAGRTCCVVNLSQTPMLPAQRSNQNGMHPLFHIRSPL